MDALAGKVAARFVVVTLLPTTFAVAVLGTLLLAGAPADAPDLGRALLTVRQAAWQQVVGLALLVLALAAGLHPAQYAAIQVLEGYWHGLPGGRRAAEWSTARQLERRRRLGVQVRIPISDAASYRAVTAAEDQRDWLPRDRKWLLPTTLGNTLRTGERRATERYGWERPAVAVARLVPLTDDHRREGLADRRNQLDAAASMCVAALIVTVGSVLLLVPTGGWLLIPLGTYALAWAFYRAAIAAAKVYCLDLAAMVDAHHRDLWRSLELAPPADLYDERKRAGELSAFLAGRGPLDGEAARYLVWEQPRQDQIG